MPASRTGLIRIGEVAARFGVTVSTVRRWEKQGSLRSVRTGERGQRFYLEADVRVLMGLGTVPAGKRES
jgi:excisionase family DNA binding protein